MCAKQLAQNQTQEALIEQWLGLFLSGDGIAAEEGGQVTGDAGLKVQT